MQLALFDLDNTLLAGDSDFQWGQFLISKGLLNEQEHLAKNIAFYEDYKAGRLDIYAFLDFQLKPLSEHPRHELEALHREYMAQKIRPMITDKARALVERHRQNGDLLVVITATNSFVTTPIAREFGIDHLIGTTPEEVDGKFTGKVTGTPSFQEGKITRLHEWLAGRDQSLSDFETTWFYSDSHNDLPLLKLVDKPVAVDPDPTLEAYAEEAGWPIISLR
ncbi:MULTISPECIES: HAD family hydrolase [Methylobacillus]|uniref:Histidinol-phosphatase n=1 Tax=Methylobacillus flagellatus (strain ATCC 51484 / DSM 6875 / VKM B-1610 / KT) TaxID=265072 RepID=Q1H3Z7_METFK|nr:MULTISPECIES: HAD family hydrolase [Methylobacillus]ABE48790.1 HAD-superfamily subfamily IB, PSPase-like protein [Methylobacillus flagellatus KT]MPS49440.1 HAD family hydrolase [Methylobacillus sp.]